MFKLYSGDCIEIMSKHIDSESIDVCVTSPPYNLDIKYGSYKDNKSNEDYLDWIENVFVEVKRTLKPNGHLFLNVSSSSTKPWIAMDVAQKLRNHYCLQNQICWVKSIEIDKAIKGHNKPVPGTRFLSRTWEYILHFTKTGNSALDLEQSSVLYSEKWREANAKRTGRNWRPTVNTWFIPYETVGSYGKKKSDVRGDHPAVYPIALVSKCLALAGNTGTLLDPFIGSGTSIIAAQRVGMNSIGIDIDVNYLEFAKERILNNTKN